MQPKFRDHKYTWAKPFTHARHQWGLRGPAGGIHFHATTAHQSEIPHCGVEYHHTIPPSGPVRASDHASCWLTRAHCWHTGSSIRADEVLWPAIAAVFPNHEKIFELLEFEYERHFETGADA